MTIAGVRADTFPIEAVRRHVLVVDREPQLLAGTFAQAVDVPGFRPEKTAGRPTVAEAIEAAAAGDIVEGLAEGLETELPERGRSLSGVNASGSCSRRLFARTRRSWSWTSRRARSTHTRRRS